VVKPALKSAIVFALLVLPLAGAILGFGIGRLDAPTTDVARGTEPPAHTIHLSLPPPTVIHPPMICRNGECSELKAGAPPTP
jgi:hypothetical protein